MRQLRDGEAPPEWAVDFALLKRCSFLIDGGTVRCERCGATGFGFSDTHAYTARDVAGRMKRRGPDKEQTLWSALHYVFASDATDDGLHGSRLEAQVALYAHPAECAGVRSGLAQAMATTALLLSKHDPAQVTQALRWFGPILEAVCPEASDALSRAGVADGVTKWR